MDKKFLFFISVLLLLLVGCSRERGAPEPQQPDESSSGTSPSSPSISGSSSYSMETLSGSVVQYDDTQWPTDTTDVDTCFCQRPSSSGFHDGLNIPGNLGDPVYAFSDGVVETTQTEEQDSKNAYGNVILIKHTLDTPITVGGKTYEEYYSVYGHLDTIGVEEGQEVKKGDVIGTEGASGAATNTLTGHNYVHLHFGILFDTDVSNEGRGFGYVNPLLFLPYADEDTMTASIVSTSPLTVAVKEKREEMDFNEISVSYQGQTKTINLDEGEGLDPEDVSSLDYDGVVMSPVFSKTGGEYYYTLTFTFSDYDGFDSVEVRDIWGKGIRIVSE